MTRQLRRGKRSSNGLVLANGGVVTYQHVICLSSQPRRDGSPYPDTNPLPEAVTDVPVPPVDEQAEGEATIEVSLAAASVLGINGANGDGWRRRTRSSSIATARHCEGMWWAG
jgi:hypothetical protein